MRINEITHRVIGAAYAVHSKVGPGLLEAPYEACMAIEMEDDGLSYLRQHPLPLYYNGRDTALSYRADFIVEDEVIVELKAVVKITPLFVAQTLTYMKLSSCHVGLLMNFNVTNMQRGIRRLVLGDVPADEEELDRLARGRIPQADRSG